MIFVSSIAAQGWIAFLDITKYFTNKLEKYRPLPSQDKYSRIAVFVLLGVVQCSSHGEPSTIKLHK